MSTALAYYSPVQISRVALQMLGATPIDSFEDDTPEAISCRDVWPLARDAALQEYPWTFATAIDRITPEPIDEDNPPPFDSYYFQLPGKCLRVLNVYDADTNEEITDWQVVGDKLLIPTDNTIYLKYIKSVDATSDWSPMFCVAVSYKMASMLAGQYNADLINAMTVLYGQAIENAIVRDRDQEPQQDDCLLNPLQLARYRA